MVKEFRKPDVKAARCRSKAPRIVNKDFLNALFEKHPELASMNISDIKEVIKLFHEKLWNHVITNRDGIELPEQLGVIFLGTCNSPKKYNVNYGESIKNDHPIRHRNFESDSYLAKIFYTNYSSKYNFKYRSLWMFEATRAFKRAVAKTYPENWKIFIQVENGRNISKYVKKSKKKDYFIKQSSKPIDDNYDEFAID